VCVCAEGKSCRDFSSRSLLGQQNRGERERERERETSGRSAYNPRISLSFNVGLLRGGGSDRSQYD